MKLNISREELNRHGICHRPACVKFIGSGKILGKTYTIFGAIRSCLCTNTGGRVNHGKFTLYTLHFNFSCCNRIIYTGKKLLKLNVPKKLNLLNLPSFILFCCDLAFIEVYVLLGKIQLDYCFYFSFIEVLDFVKI